MWPFLAHVTISGDVRNKFSIIIGTALEQLCCQWTHMFGEHFFLQSWKRFINREICIVCWLQAALWQPNMNEIYSNLPFSRKDFQHLKCREYFIIGQNMSSFHLWKYLFSNHRALWIKLNKFSMKNLTCNDVTTVCICYVLLILHLYFLSCPYSAWPKANVWHFLHRNNFSCFTIYVLLVANMLQMLKNSFCLIKIMIT